MLSTIAFSLAAMLLQPASTHPTAQSGHDPCGYPPSYTYSNDGNQPIVEGTAFTGGVLCAGDGTCQVSIQEQYSVAYTITVDTSFGLDIDDVASAGIGTSYSVTTQTAVGEGGQDTCPEGPWTCGLSIQPYMIQVSGVETEQPVCGSSSTSNYEVLIPQIDSSGNAVIKVGICACPDDSGSDVSGAPTTCPTNCN